MLSDDPLCSPAPTPRRTCGGHGYSRLSGLPDLFASYVQVGPSGPEMSRGLARVDAGLQACG